MANLEHLQNQMEELGVVDKQTDAPTLKDAAMFGAEFIPGVGEALAIKRTSDALDKQDYLGAGIEATAGLLGIIPGVGDLAGKGLRIATKKFRKADVDEAEKLIADPKKIDEWRSSNKLPESQRQKNIPEAEQAAEDLFQGNIKSKEARKRIKEVFPEPKLYTAETMPEMPTVTDVVGSMGKKSEKGILGVKGFDLEPGQRVGARLDIPAYNEYDKWVVSIHDGNSAKGSVVGYGQAIRLKNITFGSDPKVALDIARRKIIKEADPVKGTTEKRMGKATIARVFGDYVPEDPYELQMFAKKVLADKDSGWTQVGMNPYRGSYFYDKATGTPVTRADEVIQVGPLVLAKNVTKPKMSELKEMFNTPAARTADGKIRVFNEGGVVPMKEQMELFDDGGLMDEGGSVDPVSGNDVPSGSTQEEVRDDIPAQLSEGEFVLPADVVRFHGLEKIMALRDEAKAGLSKMEAMGQMGNSDEATLDDDVPFSMEDLDMEDDGVLDYNVGGVVQQQGTGIGGYQPSQFGTYVPPQIPQYQPAPIASTYQMPTQQAVPVAAAPTAEKPAPSFSQLFQGKAPTSGELDNREYINPETGEKRVFTFIGNNPSVPIPTGFIPVGQYKPEEAAIKPTTSTVGTTTRADESGRNFEPDQAKTDRINSRLAAAKNMGFTKYSNPFAGLFGFMAPGGAASGAGVSKEAGLIDGVGYVSDGLGGLVDPLTGQSVSSGFIDAISKDLMYSKLGEKKVRLAEAAESETGRSIQKQIAQEALNTKYDNLVEQASSETEKEYIGVIKDQMDIQLEKDNITLDGRIRNPFESQVSDIAAAAAEQATQSQSFSQGMAEDAAASVSSGNDGFSSQATGDNTSGRTGFNKGGDVTKQMKQSGLASKK